MQRYIIIFKLENLFLIEKWTNSISTRHHIPINNSNLFIVFLCLNKIKYKESFG